VRRPSVLLAALVAMALLMGFAAAGCTGGDDDAGPDPSGPDPAGRTGPLRLGLGAPLVADPVQASLGAPSQLMVLDLLHDGLTRLDDDGVPQPAIAADWRTNRDASAFEFQIDPEATFASGAPITPEVVIASLERVLEAGDTSLSALSLEALEGFRAFANGDAEHVSGLTAPDERTVRFELATSLSVLPVVLSNPILGVVDPETIERDTDALDLSGDWAVGSVRDGVVELTHRDGAPGRLETIELVVADDVDVAFAAFEAGDVDWAEIPAERYEEAVAEYGDGVVASFQAELFFGMNLRRPVMRSKPFRDAIRLAIDRDEIVEEAYADLADPLATVVPAGIPGHDEDRCPACATDQAAAESIVQVAFGDGEVPTVRIDFDESPVQTAMAELVAEDLESVGIPTELRPKSLDDYKSFVVSGDQELFSFGWIGAYGSPDAYLAPLFGSAANDNLTGYRSGSVDLVLAGARASTDPSVSAELWARAETEILRDAVVVPIAQFRTQAVTSARVVGLVHAVDGTVDWTQVTLDG
jgi:peptide/nickel transport system substrate-binding protein/oligopeptide transport system substrate-binding protein